MGLLPKTKLGWLALILVVIYFVLWHSPIVYAFKGYSLWLWCIVMWIYAAILIVFMVIKLKML